MVNRVYVEKRPGFDIEAQGLLADLLKYLSLPHLTGLRLFNRYDVEGLSQEEFTKAKGTIFSEPNADYVYDEALPAMEGATVFLRRISARAVRSAGGLRRPVRTAFNRGRNAHRP